MKYSPLREMICLLLAFVFSRLQGLSHTHFSSTRISELFFSESPSLEFRPAQLNRILHAASSLSSHRFLIRVNVHGHC